MDNSPTSFAISDAVTKPMSAIVGSTATSSNSNSFPWVGIFLIALLAAVLWFNQEAIKQWYVSLFSQPEQKTNVMKPAPSSTSSSEPKDQKEPNPQQVEARTHRSIQPAATQDQEQHTMAPGVADRIEQVVRNFGHGGGASYESDSAISDIQTGNKNGWCYIGEDRGYRACAPVGMRDKCMSGDIFPSHDICINPTLRA